MIDRYERYQRLEILLQRFSAATTLEEMGQVLIDIGEATGEPDLRRLFFGMQNFCPAFRTIPLKNNPPNSGHDSASSCPFCFFHGKRLKWRGNR